jgi:hypothetical protein
MYVCDRCGTSQEDPIHNGWFEVERPTGVRYRRIDDWWAETRYFCSASCLHARLEQQLRPPADPDPQERP